MTFLAAMAHADNKLGEIIKEYLVNRLHKIKSKWQARFCMNFFYNFLLLIFFCIIYVKKY